MSSKIIEPMEGHPGWETHYRYGYEPDESESDEVSFWTKPIAFRYSLFVRMLDGGYVVIHGKGTHDNPIRLSEPFSTLAAAIFAAEMIGRPE